MKKTMFLFALLLSASAATHAQKKIPPPKVEKVKFAPPVIVKDTNVNGKTKVAKKGDKVRFAKPVITDKRESKKVPE